MIIQTLMSGKGFITHADQTVSGLKFNTLASVGDITYIKVTGDAIPVEAWRARVQGTQITQAAVDAIIAARPLSELAAIKEDIKQARQVLKTDIALVAVDVKSLLGR